MLGMHKLVVTCVSLKYDTTRVAAISLFNPNPWMFPIYDYATFNDPLTNAYTLLVYVSKILYQPL
jgi:hypothetical protein